MAGDQELRRRLRAGEPDAFGLLFEQEANTVYSYCFRRTADSALAEELTSTVFLHAWRRRDRLAEVDNVIAWLLGIATNLVRNQRRSLRRYRAALARVPRSDGSADHAEDANARLDDERAMRAVLVVVERLPRSQQEVLSLCVWSQLTYREAARALGIPVGTVRSRLARARQRLRELTPADGYEELGEEIATGGWRE